MNRLHHKLVSFLILYAVCLTVILLSTVYKNTQRFRHILLPKYSTMTSRSTPVRARKLTNHTDSSINRPVILLTLFTSFKNDPLRRTIHHHTIYNWASLNNYDKWGEGYDVTESEKSMRINVQPILYTTTTDELNTNETLSAEENRIYATRLGWKIFPCPHVSGKNVPILRSMFAHALSVSHSTYYAYANGDILFSPDLVETLRELEILVTVDKSTDRINIKYPGKFRILIIGSRKDCRVREDTEGGKIHVNSGASLNDHLGIPLGEKIRMDHANVDTRLVSSDSAREGSTDEGKGDSGDERMLNLKNTNILNFKNSAGVNTKPTRLCSASDLFDKSKKASLRSAQDYFITTATGVRHLQRIPDFVIGRAGYDNWLVARTLIDDWMVIDASRTVTARHQMSSASVSRGHSAHFVQPGGDGLVNYALAGKKFDYSLGLTDCARYETVVLQINQTTKDSAERILSNTAESRENIQLMDLNEKIIAHQSGNETLQSSQGPELAHDERNVVLKSLQALDNISAELNQSGNNPKPPVSYSLEETSLGHEENKQLNYDSIRQGTIILREKKLSRYCKRAYLKNGLNPFVKRNLKRILR